MLQLLIKIQANKLKYYFKISILANPNQYFEDNIPTNTSLTHTHTLDI